MEGRREGEREGGRGGARKERRVTADMVGRRIRGKRAA